MFKRLNLLKPSWMTLVITFLISLISIETFNIVPPHQDIIYVNLYWTSPVIISQTLLLFLITWQVQSFRKVQTLVAIRGRNDLIQRRLIRLVTFEVLLYFLLFDGAFLLSGNEVFHDGSPLIGLTLLFLRALVIWLIGLLLVKTYQSKFSGAILFSAILLNLADRFIVEGLLLLAKYSDKYDPLWQIFHNK